MSPPASAPQVDDMVDTIGKGVAKLIQELKDFKTEFRAIIKKIDERLTKLENSVPIPGPPGPPGPCVSTKKPLIRVKSVTNVAKVVTTAMREVRGFAQSGEDVVAGDTDLTLFEPHESGISVKQDGIYAIRVHAVLEQPQRLGEYTSAYIIVESAQGQKVFNECCFHETCCPHKTGVGASGGMASTIVPLKADSLIKVAANWGQFHPDRDPVILLWAMKLFYPERIWPNAL